MEPMLDRFQQIKIKDLLKEDEARLKEYFTNCSTVELLGYWENIESSAKLYFFYLLETETQINFIIALSHKEQEEILSSLSTQVLRDILNNMQPDDLADLIQSVTNTLRSNLIKNLTDEVRKENEYLLKFSEDLAAGIMTSRYISISSDINIAQALEFIRSYENLASVEMIYYIYVLDMAKKLIGVISLKDLFTAKDSQLVAELMTSKLTYVSSDLGAVEASLVLEQHDLVAVPVTDENMKMMGIITFDDVIDIINEKQTKNIYRMGALNPEVENFFSSSILRLIQKRLPWLLGLLVLGTFTSNVISSNKALLASIAFLALFIPVITQTGGNAGSQTATLIIRSISQRSISFRDIFLVLGKELCISTVIAVVVAGLILLRSLYIAPFLTIRQAEVIAISLGLVVIYASLIGALVPLLLFKIKLDPAVSAGPLMTTIIDISGLSLYFWIASTLIQ